MFLKKHLDKMLINYEIERKSSFNINTRKVPSFNLR